MKTLRFSEIAFAILLMMAGFASCNEVITPEEPQEEKYVEVNLACAGEILDLTNSPLAKAEGPSGELYDVYNIKVYSLTPYPGPGTDNMHYEQKIYASGTFHGSLEGVTIRLLEGMEYRFKVVIVSDYGMLGGTREFEYSQNDWPFSIPVTSEGFYGELDRYTPVADGTVTIDTKRVSYGLRVEALNLTEGTINVSVSRYSNSGLYSFCLSSENPVHDKIYSFQDTWAAWRGTEVYGPDAIFTGQYDNYKSKKNLSFSWTKANGEVIPMGTYEVTFERNVKTTIRINAEDSGIDGGIIVNKDSSIIIDDDNIYYISGGTVTEVPVTGGN